jgi:hypothetical protein
MALVLRKTRKEVLPGRLLHFDSDQSDVRASQLAQHGQPPAVDVGYHLALGDVAPLSGAAPLPPTHDDDSRHPRGRTTGQNERHRQGTPARAGAACHAGTHLHAHAAPCLRRVGFDHTVRACGSEVLRMRGCVSWNGWKRKMAYSFHGSGYCGGGPAPVELDWKLGDVGPEIVRKKDSPATVHSGS